MTDIQFAHPHTLFANVEQVLKRVGAQKFFSSPDQEVKKAREGVAAYFFTLALKKWTGQDWWLAQYDQSDRAYPDFDFISFGDNQYPIRMEKVELTGAYPNFKAVEELIEVVEKKQKQYGKNPLDFSLLIFVNHVKSEKWIKILKERLKSEQPFLAVWTIHLLFKKGGEEIQKAVAQRIGPKPFLRIEADMNDGEIYKTQTLPGYVEEKKADGNVYVSFKTDFVKGFKSRLQKKR